ncbi:AAA family ATPase [Eubacterium limosum]|uniref:AAA family ATPase n=1 Tax=Eubacterium limosum TaxID=1736 RepID=A0ABT5ULV0_EUBLI|nr:AAA family ATPase [Eubacterium limosum]MCB6571426.1 AAA family ATPase [Eubacterium limosum]MDE1469703.1 AAA family ATPase [Eubacterium limosum]
MGTGIIICGLNGTGKSELGKALAEKLKFYFIDIEKLSFYTTDQYYIYSSQRTHEEVQKILLNEIRAHDNFVLASVKGDYGEVIYSFFQYIVLIDVPRDIRLQRVRNRSFQKFGNRILPGGDLHRKEEGFFDFVKSRTEYIVEEWVQSMDCPVIRVDGRKPVEENINLIISQIQN